MQGAIHSVLACRVILHIRQHYRRDLEEHSNWEMAVKSGSRYKGIRKDKMGLNESQSAVWQPLAVPRQNQSQREVEIQVVG
jgi:hypothetical protein